MVGASLCVGSAELRGLSYLQLFSLNQAVLRGSQVALAVQPNNPIAQCNLADGNPCCHTWPGTGTGRNSSADSAIRLQRFPAHIGWLRAALSV